MRRFVITRPGLSAGRPGKVVTADDLDMDDEQLDRFVEARYATEIHAPAPSWRSTATDYVTEVAALTEQITTGDEPAEHPVS